VNGKLVFSSLALAAHVGGPFLWGFGFLLFPLFFIILIVLFATLGRRRWARAGWGPGYGHGYGHPYFGGASRSAESTLGERFANGDIDEKEYRARLEVLRANNTFTPPAK
jgi:putative membrane protein